MAKKKYNVQDAVGDTSGFNDTPHSSSKKRKITLFIGLGGIVALIVICCIILTTPVKIEFKYNDLSKQSERYQINKSTGLITNAPSDPTKKFYEFGGWYLNSSYTIGPLIMMKINHYLNTNFLQEEIQLFMHDGKLKNIRLNMMSLVTLVLTVKLKKCYKKLITIKI